MSMSMIEIVGHGHIYVTLVRQVISPKVGTNLIYVRFHGHASGHFNFETQLWSVVKQTKRFKLN